MDRMQRLNLPRPPPVVERGLVVEKPVVNDKVAMKRSKAIDKQLKADKERMQKNSRGIKLLLLGASESGKTTVLKQLKIIHGKGLGKDRLAYKTIVHLNVVTAIKAIACAAKEIPTEAELMKDLDSPGLEQSFNIPSKESHSIPFQLEHPENHIHLDRIADMASLRGSLNRNSVVFQADPSRDQDAGNIVFSSGDPNKQAWIEEVAKSFHLLKEPIRSLWKDKGIRQFVDQGNVPTLQDSARYFFQNIDRISRDDYLPTDQDILLARVRTVGVTEHKFEISRITYRIFDIGGHRSQRHFWAPYFDDVNAIIFIAAISAYDQYLEESPEINRMDDALQLFQSICNHKLFVNTSIILFLNKIDILRRKISRGTSRVSNYFPDYQSQRPGGKEDFLSVTKFFQKKFFQCYRSKVDGKHIYVHFTHATDTKQMRVITASVSDIVSRMNLKQTGFI